MTYQDRMTLEIKEFGRKVIITVKRGKVTCTKAGNGQDIITVIYEDSPTRIVGPKRKSK